MVNLTTVSPNFIFGVIIPLLVIAMALAFVRLYRGPHLLDRVIALDLMIVVGIGIMSIFAATYRNENVMQGFLSMKTDYGKQLLYFVISMYHTNLALLSMSIRARRWDSI